VSAAYAPRNCLPGGTGQSGSGLSDSVSDLPWASLPPKCDDEFGPLVGPCAKTTSGGDQSPGSPCPG